MSYEKNYKAREQSKHHYRVKGIIEQFTLQSLVHSQVVVALAFNCTSCSEYHQAVEQSVPETQITKTKK